MPEGCRNAAGSHFWVSRAASMLGYGKPVGVFVSPTKLRGGHRGRGTSHIPQSCQAVEAHRTTNPAMD